MSDRESSQYLTFSIAGEPYAVGVAHVREIVGYDAPDIERVLTADEVLAAIAPEAAAHA